MSTTKQAKLRKMMVSAGLGFVSGIAGMTAFFRLGGDPDWSGGQVAAGAVAVIYLGTGLFALLGVAVPSLGARVLNVTDVEELLEQRRILTGSAVSIIVFGVMLLCLTGAGPGGFVPDAVALGSIAVAFVVSGVIYARQWRLYDELWRQLSWESSAFAMTLIVPALLVWGAAVQLGYLSAMDPLAVIALAAAAILGGAFIAAGRRGLLVPR